MEIIKIAGRAKVAHLDGKTIERQDYIFVKSDNATYPTVDTYSHFVYKQTWKLGSSLMCTCGGPAAVFRYDAYRKYYSTNKGGMIACISHMNTGRHADGSTE